jgi:hypothetical protein
MKLFNLGNLLKIPLVEVKPPADEKKTNQKFFFFSV